jgi:hypothetical protein
MGRQVETMRMSEGQAPRGHSCFRWDGTMG